ncbi:sensor histidine kinase [Streptomyces sp. R21]|uniref:Sensor histidine kinase n=1 Tax=Streptomyces sp. R21 TaxID=3238627 RepID=A0AB39PH19_9ACTN
MDSQDRFEIVGEGGGDTGAASPSKRTLDVPPPRLARIILWMVLVSYTVLIMLNIMDVDVTERELWVAFGLLIVIFAVQLRHSAPGANRAPLRQRCVTLGFQALLTYAPILVFHAVWGSMGGFLAGSLLLLLPSRIAWWLYGAVGVSILIPALIDHRSALDTVYLCESSLLTGLVVYGLSRLSEIIREVHAARGELARMAVTEERLRFARDLHDLLGFSLSTITLKSELIHRLIPVQPQRAMDEVQDVLSVARESLADVRRVARGFQDMSLEREIDSARSVLRAAGIGVDIQVTLTEVAKRSDSVLAAVLREAVTNVLRHSQAGHCGIEAVRLEETVRLTVVNDGVRAGYRDPSPDSGSGLANLEARVRAIGGTVVSGCRDDGAFRLVAEVPAQEKVTQEPQMVGQLGIQEPAA